MVRFDRDDDAHGVASDDERETIYITVGMGVGWGDGDGEGMVVGVSVARDKVGVAVGGGGGAAAKISQGSAIWTSPNPAEKAAVTVTLLVLSAVREMGVPESMADMWQRRLLQKGMHVVNATPGPKVPPTTSNK
mmetsp:Transcript_15698/g.47481  ORF Transcript_15698/g.47481 Transcript_15698/m.47481 type:complete len:134 (+) Transcript_15698:1976-2377(+)